MRELVGYIISECAKHEVTVNLVPNEYHSEMSGAWDDSEKTLTVATKSSEWVEVLAHEFGHFQQWKERKFEGGIYDDVYGTSVYDDWLEGNKALPRALVWEMTRAMQACELDAEKRAYKLLKRFGVDTSRYIQKANAYVLFYNVMAKRRQWCDKKSPSRIPEILDLMPDKFISDVSVMPKGYERLVLKHCFMPKTRWQRFKEWWHS